MKLAPENTRFSTNNTLNVCGRLIDLTQPRLMGILNVTPDSFYDGGLYNNEAAILKRAEQIATQGATFLDIGGYSTRPGAADITEEEELARVIGPVRMIADRFPEVILAIDTFRSRVAKEAIAAGARMINDVSGGELDPAMPTVAAQHQVPYIIMHMRGTPQTMSSLTQYENLLLEMTAFFQSKISAFTRLGIADIIIDPGFGFAKTLAQNFEILSHLEHFSMLERPLLVGLSRKSMIWKTLGINAGEAANGTTALNTLALTKGARILRVHDVREAREVLDLLAALHAH
jgi:dihydropteroate synthase